MFRIAGFFAYEVNLIFFFILNLRYSLILSIEILGLGLLLLGFKDFGCYFAEKWLPHGDCLISSWFEIFF